MYPAAPAMAKEKIFTTKVFVLPLSALTQKQTGFLFLAIFGSLSNYVFSAPSEPESAQTLD